MTVPNMLTWFRVAMVPVVVGVYYLPFFWAHYAAMGIFALAAVTDWFDGFLARKLSQASDFGAFLDPVADKVMVAVVLVLLVGNPKLPLLVLPAMVIVGREIVISALREWMAELGSRTSVAVSIVGKVKTALQMIAILILLAYQPLLPKWWLWSGVVLLYVAAILTLWSMIQYLRTAWLYLR